MYKLKRVLSQEEALDWLRTTTDLQIPSVKDPKRLFSIDEAQGLVEDGKASIAEREEDGGMVIVPDPSIQGHLALGDTGEIGGVTYEIEQGEIISRVFDAAPEFDFALAGSIQNRVEILRRIKVGYYEFTEFTDKQLAFIRAIAPELQLPDMGEDVMNKVKERIDNEIQDLVKLEDEVVFFFGKEITADRQTFKSAFEKLPTNNRAIVIVENDTKKAPLELILDELGILEGSYEIMTFEQAGLIKAGVTPADIDSYLMQVLGIDGIHCLPLIPAKLKLHPELEEVRRRV